MSKPFFSVIIPTFNRAELLPKAARSLLAQTETSWEAIIADDGSTDNTKEIAEKIIKENNQFKYLQHSHIGTGAIKNFAIKFAKGRYITFLDDDDEYLPEHLLIRKKILEKQVDLDFLYGGIKVVGDEFVPDKYNPGKQIHISQVVTGGNFFIKKDVFDKIGYFPEKNFGNDTEFYEKVVQNKLKTLKITDPTYIYNRTDNSITKKYQ